MNKNSAPKELQNKETAEGRLVSYMTSQSPVLSFCVSDFIFALCGDNGLFFLFFNIYFIFYCFIFILFLFYFLIIK